MTNCSSRRGRARRSWLMSIVAAGLAFAAMALPVPLPAGPDAVSPADAAKQEPAVPCVWLQQALVALVLQGRVALPAEGDLAIDLFRNGTTLVPLSSTFPATLPKGDPGRLNAAIAGWKEGGRRKVFGVVEALRWAEQGEDHTKGVLGQHPEWQAVNEEGACHPAGSDGAYASPYHPDVRRALVALANRAGEALPALDGILISAGLTTWARLDLSEMGRVACIRQCQIDPIDMVIPAKEPQDRAIAQRWSAIQRDAVTAVFREMAASYRRARPGGRVIGLGWSPCYFVGDYTRGCIANDWLAWVKDGLVDEVWLYGSLRNRVVEKAFSDTIRGAAKLARQAGKSQIRGVAFAHPCKTGAELQADVKQAEQEVGGPPVVVVRREEELEWLGLKQSGVPETRAKPAALESKR